MICTVALACTRGANFKAATLHIAAASAPKLLSHETTSSIDNSRVISRVLWCCKEEVHNAY